MIERSEWTGLYRERWIKNETIVPDAMGHPAKFSRDLIRKIYAHVISEGWMERGDIVIDPFGGVGLGGLDAMLNGMVYIGNELEERFYSLGQENIGLWYDRYGGKMPNLGEAYMTNGDSRNLVNILNTFSSAHASELPRVAVSSPPFLQTSGGTNVTSTTGPLSDGRLLNRHSAGNAATKAYGESDGNLGNMRETPSGFPMAVSSPPYGDISQSGGTRGLKEHGTGLTGGEAHFAEYGSNGAQVGKMPVTEDGYSISVSSPPYAEARIGQNSGQEQCGHNDAYGGSDGQLGTMKDRGFVASISSPPFADVTSDRPSRAIVASGLKMGASSMGDGYGSTDGQLGSTNGSDFWIASRDIIDQVYSALRPGGHAIWVCKKYVKNRRLVNFDRMWAKVCVAAGFRVIHWHRAWVVETVSTQYDLYGNAVDKTFQRKSFFRMLAERKGAPEINWETVICMEKPL